MIRAVFFDVGGTLIRARPSVGAVYARVAGEFGVPATEEAMEEAFWRAWRLTKGNGALTSSDRQWWRQLVGRVMALQGLPEPAGYFERLFEVFGEAEAWEVFADVVPALESCRRRGWHVGVISNWDERLRPLLDRLGLRRYLDSVTVSCEVGVEKPATEIFQAALRVAGVRAEEALHIGDSPQEDVAGAEAAGLRGVLVRQPGCVGVSAVISCV